ncbi:hypothetical protein C2845_PM12G16360 [Panicum miliaceum]|uniref:F-box domain-containing protein n=1 Tax=Panicum miliaceum TaxID=4540 RepID=A0A3L6QK36_PANMI|nr:hypothetical protein C2845_PM12G16360 [Panicum miliaceum]
MESAAVGRNDDEGRRDKVSAPLAVAADNGLLPTDLLREILLRLPADALCRLRLVCRPWRWFTSDPGFANAHATRHLLITGLDRSRRAVHTLDMSSGNILRRILVPRQGFDLTTAQPDLVCVSPDHGPSFLLNSVTGVVATMPKNVGCAVESPSILGLVPATGEYKVLRFHLESMNRSMVQYCHVVTLGVNRRWRAGSRPPMIIEWRRSGHRVVMGGVAYFLLGTCLLNSASIGPDSIASFDLATEEWRPTMAGPLSSSGSSKLLYHKHRHEFRLAKLNGCLVTVHHYQDCLMNLWFLVDADKGIWAKKHSIQCEPGFCKHACDPPHPLSVLNDERIVFRVLGGVLRAYDPSTSMWADLASLGGYSAIGIHEGSLLCSSVQPINPDP